MLLKRSKMQMNCVSVSASKRSAEALMRAAVEDVGDGGFGEGFDPGGCGRLVEPGELRGFNCGGEGCNEQRRGEDSSRVINGLRFGMNCKGHSPDATNEGEERAARGGVRCFHSEHDIVEKHDGACGKAHHRMDCGDFCSGVLRGLENFSRKRSAGVDDDLTAKIFTDGDDFLRDASDSGVGDAEPEDVRVESGASPCTAEDFVWAEISGFQSCNER